MPCEKRAYSKSHEAVSVANLFISLGFAIWVSVCAAAPEFIWQGMLELLHHFSRQTAYSIVLIGLILTVFVEPILAWARDGQWQPQHRSTQSLLFTAPIAFVFGLAAVGLHECMTAYLGAPGDDPAPRREAMARGANLILEWACIPLAVTMAWFSARLRGGIPYLAGACAAVWVIGAGLFYNWPLPGIAITSIPCIALIPMGQAYVARHWDEHTFRNLAIGLAAFSVFWLAMTSLVQAAMAKIGIAEIYFYAPGDLSENFRFYLGWAVGLTLAPNPVSTKANETSRFHY